MSKKYKFAIAIAVVALTLSYLVYAGVKDTLVYYLTINEMIERAPEVRENRLRVSGSVVPGSIDKHDDGSIEFVITDGANNVDVQYKGIIPDVFRDNVEAIVEGKYTRDNVFKADVLLAKCPTKYESTEGLESRKEYIEKYRDKGYPLKGRSLNEGDEH